MIARRQLCVIECAQRSLTGRLGPTRFSGSRAAS